MVAFVGLGDEFVDPAGGDLCKDAVAFSDGQQNRVEHGVHALHHLALDSFKLFRPGPFGQAAFLRSLY